MESVNANGEFDRAETAEETLVSGNPVLRRSLYSRTSVIARRFPVRARSKTTLHSGYRKPPHEASQRGTRESQSISFEIIV